ncbi:helix-turn-helix domain-containing protein [Nocardia crassostreae]|uniref:helix-turn-helix domain-containing protein n=1 Tax=Nocardia crassostreae TaxID=53428 RepID=UPI00082E9F24|nr:helix-turn-helix domain-containing protein [Nocardia crassostreae]
MAEARSSIAGYLRERREAAGLTRAELARKAGVSEALIQKLEQGTRPPTSATLGALFEALDVPAQFREYAASVMQPELTALGFDDEAPSPAELAFLNSLPYPACYQTLPSVDLIAANEAYLRAFPGLAPGGNIIEWMLLNPNAKYVLEDWEGQTHFMVFAFRHMAPGVVAPERMAEVIEVCGRSPDWERFWSTEIAPADIPRRPIRVRSAETGERTTMHIHLFRVELPRRPWSMYTLVPSPDGD